MGFPGKIKFPTYPIILPGVATRVSFDHSVFSAIHYLKALVQSRNFMLWFLVSKLEKLSLFHFQIMLAWIFGLNFNKWQAIKGKKGSDNDMQMNLAAQLIRVNV